MKILEGQRSGQDSEGEGKGRRKRVGAGRRLPADTEGHAIPPSVESKRSENAPAV